MKDDDDGDDDDDDDDGVYGSSFRLSPESPAPDPPTRNKTEIISVTIFMLFSGII